MKKQAKKRSALERVIDELIIRSWWVILFACLCFFTYDIAKKKKQAELIDLRCQLNRVEKEQILACETKENLTLRIKSQSDPA